MNIVNLQYFNENLGSGIYGTLDDPYIQNIENKTQISKDLRWKSEYLWLRWDCKNKSTEKKTVELHPSGMCQAALDRTNKYVVVIFSGCKEWPWPSNAAAFNADGSIRGEITPPTGLTPEPIEGIGGVKMKDDKIVLWCYYNYDRLVYIEFDPETMQWGRVIHIGGRA